jgi:phosphotransferase system HPr (HPr) family protein
MKQFESAIHVTRGDKIVDGKKLFALMGLRVKCGETIVVSAEGDDASQAIDAAKDILSKEL